MQPAIISSLSVLVQQLLNTDRVLSDVMNSHISTDGIMRNVCDGNYCKNHELFGQDHTALQVIAHYDDVDCESFGI